MFVFFTKYWIIHETLHCVPIMCKHVFVTRVFIVKVAIIFTNCLIKVKFDVEREKNVLYVGNK